VCTAAGSWRWPAEVAPDQEWEHFQHLFSNEEVRQWRPRLLICIRVHGGHFEHRLSMFNICTNVHFDSTMSVWLPIVDTYVLGDLTKPAITIAGVDRFYWNFAFCLQLDVALLLQNFAKIQHCLPELWKCIQWFTFFRTQFTKLATMIVHHES